MLETLWYALLLMVQCVQVDPAVHDKQLVLDVYIESTLAYSLEHKGALSSGYFFDVLSHSHLGDYEVSRRAGRTFTVVPDQAVEDIGTDTAASGDEKTARSSSVGDVASPEEPELPGPFFMDLTPALRIMAPFSVKAAQDFPYTAVADGTNSGGISSAARASAKANTAPVKTGGQAPGTAGEANPSTGAETGPSFMRVYEKAGHWVLTADFSGFIIVASFR